VGRYTTSPPQKPKKEAGGGSGISLSELERFLGDVNTCAGVRELVLFREGGRGWHYSCVNKVIGQDVGKHNMRIGGRGARQRETHVKEEGPTLCIDRRGERKGNNHALFGVSEQEWKGLRTEAAKKMEETWWSEKQ